MVFFLLSEGQSQVAEHLRRNRIVPDGQSDEKEGPALTPERLVWIIANGDIMKRAQALKVDYYEALCWISLG